MFEENFKNIELTNGEIFFLAAELKLEKIIGLGIDYEAMNKETKMEFKQESYDWLQKHEAIQMDFSGNTVVNNNYATVIKAFEKPERCVIVQHKDVKNDISDMRKIYLNNSIYTALEYVDENVCQVYEFSNGLDSNKFILFNLNIDVKDENASKPDSKNFETVEAVIKESKEFAIITEYVLRNGNYQYIESIYVNISDVWYYLESDNENNINANPVTEEVTIF
ncbi:MAG: hypothetical protein J1E81_00495 [Eubacterium sp.]|nr:hypothetical protein [Eubacterium sp.]